MANLRTLKKDLQALVNEVVEDCGNVIVIHPEKSDDVMKLIENALTCYNNCIDKVNSGKGQKKAYFSEILNDMLKCADDSFEKLRTIVNAK